MVFLCICLFLPIEEKNLLLLLKSVAIQFQYIQSHTACRRIFLTTISLYKMYTVFHERILSFVISYVKCTILLLLFLYSDMPFSNISFAQIHNIYELIGVSALYNPLQYCYNSTTTIF